MFRREEFIILTVIMSTEQGIQYIWPYSQLTEQTDYISLIAFCQPNY